jgi:uncharacterized protein (UPF0332 family)
MTKSDLLLERADRSLRSAEILLTEGDAEAAASRIYYTCFYTAQALLATRGLKFSRHGQVIAQYGRYFSKTRLLDPRFQKLLKTTFELRGMADYQVEVPIESEIVSNLIPECRQFIAAASRYIEELKTPPDEGEPAPSTP